MSVEIGHFALVLSLAVAILQMLLPVAGVRFGDSGLMRLADRAAALQFLLVGIAFACFTAAYLSSDFSVRNVFENSHSLKPLIYKFSGVWGNHEGSMLLWVLILALSGAAVAAFGQGIPLKLRANVLSVQASISVAFLLFTLFTSNPFERLLPPPLEGRDLNPLLQDLGLAIHPPLLYVGYVGLSVAFSFAIAALIDGRVDAAWARFARPWILGAWIFLTLGIAMGSYWAYYELGWGGWWFWDPVENASLMPWFAATALIHSATVMEKRGALKVWTILLAILAFSLSLLGTFIVRSGVLTSVHSFASDPARGVIILLILCLFVGGSLALFAWRAPQLQQGGLFAPVSREGALVINNLFLSVICVAVFVGTLYPLALEAWDGSKISVGPPFFNAVFIPLALPLIMAMPFGQQLAWKRGDIAAVAQRLVAAIALAVFATLLMLAYFGEKGALAPIGVGVGLFAIAGSISEIVTRAGRGGASGFLRRALGLPISAWGSALAHAGVGVMVLGVSATAYEIEHIANVRQGESFKLGTYELVLSEVQQRQGPNYRDLVAVFHVRSAGVLEARLEPAKRVYTARQMPTTEVARLTRGFGQIYVALGESADQGPVPVRAYWKPFVLFIWLGAVLMAFGGCLSLTERRIRVGAPVPARKGSTKAVRA
ncbi:MAG: heme lyase CcmF/NrfE family subunit [Beijerinckiaceae bacterium]